MRPGAPRVIAIHGWLDNAATWDLLLPLLECYDVCALDLPGHGHSDHRPAGAPYHFVDNVADVIGAADALGWQEFGLLGHSLGASVATLVAGTIADRVTHVVCIEGFGALTTPADGAPAQLRKSIRRYADSRGERRRFSSLDEAVKARAGATRVSLDAARHLCERGTLEDSEGLTWSSDPRLRYDSPVRLTEEQVLAFIAAIRAPVLLIRAKDGLDFPKDIYRVRVAACRNLRRVELPGHHHLHLESETVAAVAGEIASFDAACDYVNSTSL